MVYNNSSFEMRQDCCLIPESPFFLEGKGGLFEFIEQRLKENRHMVIVIAEGAGQDYVSQSMHVSGTKDASGNRLLLDVGLWLTQQIKVFGRNSKAKKLVSRCFSSTTQDEFCDHNAAGSLYKCSENDDKYEVHRYIFRLTVSILLTLFCAFH